LKIVLDLDDLENEYDSPELALDTLLGRQGWYDPSILQALAEIRVHQRKSDIRELPLASLLPGMVLAKDVRVKNGMLYLARGQEITESALEKLNNWSSRLHGIHAMRVLVNGTMASGEDVE
jgi:hypothetical protein